MSWRRARARRAWRAVGLAPYLAGRLVQAAVVMWIAYTLTFIGILLLPSNPITIVLYNESDGAGINPTVAAQMKAYYGYNQPQIVRYFIQLGEVIRGNLGYSLSAGESVSQAIVNALPNTLELASSALVVAFILSGLIVGIAQLSPWTRLRGGVRVLPPVFGSVPTFWVGIVALEVLSFRLGLMPVFPNGSFLSLFVPAVVLSLPLTAVYSQVLLKSVDAVYDATFIEVVRAKGAGKYWVFLRHVLKNAAGPGLTVFGNSIGILVGGTVVTETVFSRTGVGTVLFNAVSEQDIPLVQGFVLIVAATYVVVNLVVDLIYPLLDPRIALVRSAAVSQ
jgi:peptide/nickel transport system permease protein